MTMEKGKLLYVDDEDVNLTNFKMAFMDDYAILTAKSGDEALAVFEENRDIGVVVADQRMPGMSGVELFEKILGLDPTPVRIILTAYTDVQDIIGAINRGQIHQYVTKPWDEDRLRVVLMRSQETYRLARSNMLLLAELQQKNCALDRLNQELQGVNQQLSTDIARRRQIEAALRDSEGRYRSLVETMRDAVCAFDLEGRFTYCSPMVEKMLGFKTTEMLGQHFMRYLSPACRDFVVAQFRTGLAGQTQQAYQAELLCKSGTQVPVEINASTLFDDHGRPAGRIGVARDITWRRQEEKKSRELEIKMLSQAKLAALGEIATGIAHEINQPLSYIKIIFEAALRDMRAKDFDEQEFRADFDEALRQVARITEIINHLRTFGRADAVAYGSLRLETVLDNALILMGERMRLANIGVRRRIDADLPAISGNAIRLEQILVNMFQNSIDALQDRKDGEVVVTMQRHADNAVLKLTDNGLGMPPEIRGKIFEPFFTTKAVGRGTGVGLAIVYGIVQEHGGNIECESTVGRGTTFTIRLPLERRT